MQWIKKIIYILKGIFGMSMPNSFEEAVQSLQTTPVAVGTHPVIIVMILFLFLLLLT